MKASSPNIVVRLLEDPARRAAMSAEARAYAATWSASAMADRLAGLYSAVLGQASQELARLAARIDSEEDW